MVTGEISNTILIGEIWRTRHFRANLFISRLMHTVPMKV